MAEEQTGEIVQLFPDAERSDHDAPLTTKKEPSWCRESHRRLQLDTEARRVYCRDCGREVPPFDALKSLTRDWERYVSARKEAQREARRRQEDLEEILRQERNAKARVSRLRRGEAAADFERLAQIVEAKKAEDDETQPRERRELVWAYNSTLAHVARVIRAEFVADCDPVPPQEGKR